MSLLGIFASVIASVVAVFTILVALGAIRLRRTRNAHRDRVASVGTAELAAQANFFGQASDGKSQIRGLGTLVLTDTELAFIQLMPQREVRVNRELITSVRATRHFLGKTPGHDLLVVMWEANGMGDAAAFDVPDIESWRAKLS